jgi:PAS domain S-box-containing protein
MVGTRARERRTYGAPKEVRVGGGCIEFDADRRRAHGREFSPRAFRTSAERLNLARGHSSGSTLTQIPDVDRLYRLLVEQVTDYAIFVLSPNGTVLTWNPGAERFKGYKPDEIIGRHFSVFYTPEDAASGLPQRLLDRAAKEGHASAEGWRVRKDGSRFWASVTITALHDATGRLTAFAKITRDLTERRENEERARHIAAEEAAHAATRAKNAELERLTRQLQDQTAELESQTEEAQSLAEELEQANEELQSSLIEVEETREAATRSDRFSRAILDSISDPFAVVDAQWNYRFVNPAAAAMMNGAAPADEPDLIGKNLWLLFPEYRDTVFEHEMRRAMDERTPTVAEARQPGRGEWWLVQCYPLPEGGLAVQWRDITVRKRAEEAGHYLARASEILSGSLDYRQTLNDLAHLVVPELADWCAVEIAGENGTLEQVAVAHVDPEKVRWGRELSRRYPTPRDAAIGAYHVLRTGRPELHPEVTDDMLVASAIDDEHLRISRELGIRSVMLVPLSAHDRVLGVLTLITSESRRRYNDADLRLTLELAHRAGIAVENARLHEDTLRSEAEAKEANRAKTEFLATMSHELRTPLNAISGYTSLLQLGVKGPLTPEQADYVERIARSGRYLLSLIQDVLSFAKLEAGRVELTIEPVDVAPLLREMETLMDPLTKSAGLTLVQDTCEPDVQVAADKERLQQILLNLVSNAVKFTPPDGTIHLGCRVADDTVTISVRDSGPGIPADKLEAVFAPFVQLRRDTAGSQAGTGLGLAISRDLAREMHGDLTVQSDVGVGSEFLLRLPRPPEG